MGFSLANLTRWMLPAGLALAAACSVMAQGPGRRPGQAILFSSADDGGGTSNMPSLTAQPAGLPDFANVVQSPSVNFDTASRGESLPAPQTPAVTPDQARQMQRLLDERKNWALLTPGEILGLPTPEKILGISDRDAFGQPKNETVTLRYFERQEQSRVRTNVDNSGAEDAASRRDFSGSLKPQMDAALWIHAGGGLEKSAMMNQFLNETPDGGAQAADDGWPKSFNLPAQPPKPTPEQQAAMEQFQQLLQPHSPSGSPAKFPSFGSPIFSAPPTSPNPVPGQAAVIPVGASYTPLSSGIAVPSGVAPLPGLLGPTNAALPAFAPEWKPQPPPWMSSAPQPGVIPQRKF
jgi:hypothetical protein